MTVQIVGHRDDIEHRATCHGCGSILTFKRADTKHGYEENSRGAHYLYIECPRCKTEHAANPNIENIGRVRVSI